jgi:flavin reductase (DIM6/NTAB) family NADH-FMN oxidoreductase RutF
MFVVSSSRDKQIAAMTASWVHQVSFDPPLVAVAVHKDRAVRSSLKLSGGFVVSVLKRGQDDLARHFSQHFGTKDNPFKGIETVETDTDTPAIRGSLCFLECRTHEQIETGDHTLFVGEVIDARILNDGEPAIRLRDSGFDY